MKKLLLIILMVFALSGCTKITHSDNYVDIVNNIYFNGHHLTNKASTGYKYYLPKGTRLIYDSEFNQNIRYLDNNIYLYVDVVSYYYSNDLNYKIKDHDNAYYYEEIVCNDKTGYIFINQEEDNYYVIMVYNYAKIEFYSDYQDLNKMVNISAIILNNIEYNKKMIKNMIDTSSLSKEMVYELDKPSDASSKYSQYLEEYVQEEKQEELPDDE